MPKAKLLTRSVLEAAQKAIAWSSDQPFQDLAMLSLSYRAGLRAKEMALLRIEGVTNATGGVANFMRIRAKAAKGGKARSVSITPALADSIRFHISWSATKRGLLLRSRPGKPMTAKAVVQRFINIYRRAGLLGASSHSGRRTLATLLSRGAEGGCTLPEIMACLGHSNVDTTMAYIDSSEDLRDLIMTIR